MSTPAYSANIQVRSFILPAYNSIHISDIHFKCYNIKRFLQKSIRAYWSKLRVQTNSFFQNNPNSFRDYHYMVLPQTFLYRISAMQSFKSIAIVSYQRRWQMMGVYKSAVRCLHEILVDLFFWSAYGANLSICLKGSNISKLKLPIEAVNMQHHATQKFEKLLGTLTYMAISNAQW